MNSLTIRCPVLGDDVGLVLDENGEVINVVCPKFMRVNYNCNEKRQDVGVLGSFVGRIADITRGSKVVVCDFIDPAGSLTARLASRMVGGSRPRK